VQPLPLCPLLRRIFLLLFLIFSPFPASAADTPSLDDAVRQLADRVSTIPNLRGPLRLQFFEDANFASNTGKSWQDTFRKEIEAHHLALTDDPTAALLRIGLAETPTHLVLSASIHISEKEEVRFLTLPRTAFHAANLPVAPVRIERQLVYQGSDRILDVSSLGNGVEGGMALLALHNAELSVLRIDSSGELTQTISLVAANSPPSRDPRGELTIRASDGNVLLPSKICDFTWTNPADAKCRSAKTTWRATTILTPSCDAGGWKLLSDGSDWATPDVLQVVPDGSLREGSAALLSDFAGPILSINGEQNPANALIVARNLRTGNYEVYKITLACGN